MLSRSFGFLIFVNALMSDSPSGVAVNLEAAASECPSGFHFEPFAKVDGSSKKKGIGTCMTLAMYWSRLALTSVRAFFILLHLLERYPERPGKVGLVQIEHQASHADAIPDVHVSSMW